MSSLVSWGCALPTEDTNQYLSLPHTHLATAHAGLPLPVTVSMAYEFQPNTYPLNAGVMLMNLPMLRVTYRRFLRFIMANKHGMFFGDYGPADQGAFNQFYEAQVRRVGLGGEVP